MVHNYRYEGILNHKKVTLSELKQQQQNVVAERERQIALKLQEDKKKSEEEMKRKKKEKKRLKKYQNKNKISFGDDEEIVEGVLRITPLCNKPYLG